MVPRVSFPVATGRTGIVFPGNDSPRGRVPWRPRPTRLGPPDTCSEQAAEAAISENHQSSWAYAEEFVAEDGVLATARAKGDELGCVPVQPGAGAALRLLAATVGAKAVVEVGTGAGVASVWLLRGMRPDGVLTTVDVEPEHQRAARETLTEAGIPANRVRLISGRALEVLPRLSDGGYDLVFVDADKADYPDYLEQALRLLRPGAWWPSTTRCGMARSPTRLLVTRRPRRSVSSAGPCATTSGWSPACCPAVTGCCAPSRGRSRPNRGCLRPRACREPRCALGHTDDLERLVQHRR